MPTVDTTTDPVTLQDFAARVRRRAKTVCETDDHLNLWDDSYCYDDGGWPIDPFWEHIGWDTVAIIEDDRTNDLAVIGINWVEDVYVWALILKPKTPETPEWMTRVDCGDDVTRARDAMGEEDAYTPCFIHRAGLVEEEPGWDRDPADFLADGQCPSPEEWFAGVLGLLTRNDPASTMGDHGDRAV